jgi:hypothetical protein
MTTALMSVVGGSLGATANAAPADAGSFRASGQVNGLFTVNGAETCAPGNVSKVNGFYDIRLYLVDHGAAPVKALWGILLSVKKTGHTVMSRLDGMTVGFVASGGAFNIDSWYGPSNKGGMATLSLAANAKSGALVAHLEASGGKAVKQEDISGSWSCG